MIFYYLQQGTACSSEGEEENLSPSSDSLSDNQAVKIMCILLQWHKEDSSRSLIHDFLPLT